MKILSALRVSVRGLFAHKVRTALAVSSVAAGVVAVVVIGAIGEGAKQEVLRQTESVGTNVLVIRPGQVAHSAARQKVRGVVSSLRMDDYLAITQLPQVVAAAPGIENVLSVKADNRAMSAAVLGTTSPYIDISRFHLRQGRLLTPEDDLSVARIAVIGPGVNDILFPQENAVGKQIRIRGVLFEVIGVLESKGVLPDGTNEDDKIIIPIQTAQRRVYNSMWLNPIYVSVRDLNEMDETTTEITQLLRDRHRLAQRAKPDDFAIQDKTKMLAVRKRLSESLTLLATGLAGVSLVVGGAGILALMLMSVKERTTEIGLRIAIGAKPRDILLQFLLEAASIAAGGWMVGMVLGTVVALIIASTTNWKTSVSPELVLSTLAVVAGSGLGFGAYPARKASLMPPIQALRMD